MAHATSTVQEPGPVFRLAYASRARADMVRPRVVTLARNAAANNSRNRVSGILFSGKGFFLQWLEGPAEDVCSLMTRIADDRRHRDVTVLSAGWMPARRFARWPMQLADTPLEQGRIPLPGTLPYDFDRAMLTFDNAATHYKQQEADATDSLALAERMAGAGDAAESMRDLAQFAQMDLHERAQLVDAACVVLAKGWQDDTRSSVDVAVGLARLNSLWQRAGRVGAPLDPLNIAAIVVPPGSSEILGAIVKADLLHAAGVDVQLVMEPDQEATVDAIAQVSPGAIVVAGPRAGPESETRRALALAEKLQARFPDIPLHIGGRAAGPLCDIPQRVGFDLDKANAVPASGIEWLVVQALSVLSAKAAQE